MNKVLFHIKTWSRLLSAWTLINMKRKKTAKSIQIHEKNRFVNMWHFFLSVNETHLNHWTKKKMNSNDILTTDILRMVHAFFRSKFNWNSFIINWSCKIDTYLELFLVSWLSILLDRSMFDQHNRCSMDYPMLSHNLASPLFVVQTFFFFFEFNKINRIL